MLLGFFGSFWLLRCFERVYLRPDITAASGTREQEPDALVAHPQPPPPPENSSCGPAPRVLTGRQRRSELPSSRHPRSSGLRELGLLRALPPTRPRPKSAEPTFRVQCSHFIWSQAGRSGCAARGEHRETRSPRLPPFVVVAPVLSYP